MQFDVLGPVALRTAGGEPVALRRKMCDLLAAFLLHPNRARSSDHLKEWLWGDAQPATADTALRVHLGHLRAALREPGAAVSRLGRTPYGYVVTVQPGELDVEKFEEAVRHAAGSDDPYEQIGLTRSALALWRGDAYGGIDDIDAVAAAREQVHQLRFSAVLLLGEALLATHQFETLAAEATEWLTLYPTAERLARLRSLALYHGGDQVAAVRALRSFIEHLRDEFGLEPTPQLAAVEGTLLAQPLPPSAPPPRDRRRVLAEPGASLVERHELLATVHSAIDRAGDSACVIVLAGEAGAGKTAIMRAIHAALDGSILVTAGQRAAPLSAIGDIAAAVSLAAGPPNLTHDDDADAHSRAATQLRAAIGGGHRTVLIDNVDLLDPDSVEVLRRLLDCTQLTWVTSCRSSVLADHPLLADRSLLGATTVFEVPPLTAAGTIELATRHGWTTAAEDADALLSATGGNPFLTSVLARWRSQRGDEGGVPPQVTEHVRRILDDLGPLARRWVELAALDIGRRVDPAFLATAARIDLDRSVGCAEAALGVGLLTDVGGELMFRHDLVRLAVDHSLGTQARCRLHTDLVSAIREVGAVGHARLAHHLRQSLVAVSAEAAEATAREAEESLAAGAGLAAVAQIEQAIDLGGRSGAHARQLIEWGLLRCDALNSVGRLIHAQDAAATLADEARRAGTLDLFASAACRSVGPFVPTGVVRAASVSVVIEALDWFDREGVPPTTALCEAAARALVGRAEPATIEAAERVRALLQPRAHGGGHAEEQALASLGLRALAWQAASSAGERSRHATSAAAAARRAGNRRLLLQAQHGAVGDLFAAADDAALGALDLYTAEARAAGSTLHRWIAARMAITWALTNDEPARLRAAESIADELVDNIDPETAQDATLGTMVSDHLRRGRLADLGHLQLAPPTDSDFAPVIALGLAAIDACAAIDVDLDFLALSLARVARTPFELPAAAFAATATIAAATCGQYTTAAVRPVAELICSGLSPHTGGLVLLDGGLACMGPVDGYLAACHRLLDQPSSAQYHHRCAQAVAARCARGWTRWVEETLQ